MILMWVTVHNVLKKMPYKESSYLRIEMITANYRSQNAENVTLLFIKVKEYNT